MIIYWLCQVIDCPKMEVMGLFYKSASYLLTPFLILKNIYLPLQNYNN